LTEILKKQVRKEERSVINGLLNAKDVTEVLSFDCENNAQSTKDLYQLALDKHPEAEKFISFPITRNITKKRT
jgi:hypothetical protein